MPSLRRARKKLQKQVVRLTIWGTVFVIFLAGTFTVFSGWKGPVHELNLPSTIARVNGAKISRQTFDQALSRFTQSPFLPRPTVSDWTWNKKMVLDQLIDSELLKQEAWRRGVRVTRADINKRVEEMVQMELVSARSRYQTDKSFRDFIRQRYGSLDGYADELRQQARQQAEGMEDMLLMEKLRQAVEREVKVTQQDLRDSYTKFRLRHIFVSTDRFLPKSKEKGPTDSDRQKAKEKALERAQQLRERLLKGEDFAELAKKESDDPMTAKKGGELGEVTLDSAKWQVGDGAVSILPKLKIGDISEPIESFNGYHIVKLEGRKLELPEDYRKVRYRCENEKCNNIWLGDKGEKQCPKCKGKKIKQIGTRKRELLEEMRQRRASEHWSRMMEELRKNARVEIYDPELQAIQAFREGDREKAKKLYREALRIARENPESRQHSLFPDVLHYELARLYLGDGKMKEAEREIREALKYSNDNDLHLELGRVLMHQGKKEAALKELQGVARSSPTPNQRNLLAQYFEQLGRKDLAEEQRKLAEKERPKGMTLPLNIR